MFPNYFKYKTSELRKKFKQIIETNQMLRNKQDLSISLPEFQKQIAQNETFFQYDDIQNISLFTDIQDISQANISAILEQPDENFSNSFKHSMEESFDKIKNLKKMILFKNKDDIFYDYKIKIFELLLKINKSLKNKKRDNLNSRQITYFTKETMVMVENLDDKKDLSVINIFNKMKNNSQNLQEIKNVRQYYVDLLEKVDVTIMYQIIVKFQNFVESMRIITEIDQTVTLCHSELSFIKTQNRKELYKLIKYNKNITKRAKCLLNLRNYYERLIKVNDMRNMFDIINQKLNSQDFDEALELYENFQQQIANNQDDKIFQFFKGYFLLLSENLTKFLRNNFETLFLNYFKNSFEYYNQLNENTFINELNISVNLTYDFELDSINWLIQNKERNIQLENNISQTILNLLKIQNINLQNFQSNILLQQNQLNQKLIQDLFNFCQAKVKNKVKDPYKRYFFNSLKFFFEINMSSIEKFLHTIKSIYSDLASYLLQKENEWAVIVNSKQFVIIENLYHILLVLLKKYQVYSSQFLKTNKIKNPSFQDLKNYSVIFDEIEKKLKEDIYQNLIPPNDKQSYKKDLYFKMAAHINSAFDVKEQLQTLDAYRKEILQIFHFQNIALLENFINNESWQEINISYDIKHALKQTIGFMDSHQIQTANTKLWVDNQKYYISKSFSFVISNLECYLKFKKFFERQETILSNQICDILSIYNQQTYKIIIGGECVNYKAIKKITGGLLMFLNKELKLIDTLFNTFFEQKIIKNQLQIEQVKNDIFNHQKLLEDNIFFLLKDMINTQAEKLEQYNWEESTYRFLSPSVESCNIINFITELVKQIQQFLDKKELEQFFDDIISIVINEYISRMETFIQISEQNIQNLNNERKFVIENLDKLKQELVLIKKIKTENHSNQIFN